MPRITLSIPDELKAKLDKHPEINWAEVTRQILKSKVDRLLKFENMVKKGEL